MLKVNGDSAAAEKLRRMFRQMDEKRANQRMQEDKDFEKVSNRLEWLLENQYVVTPGFLSHDTGIPLERIKAIEDRLGELASTIIGDGCYCP